MHRRHVVLLGFLAASGFVCAGEAEELGAKAKFFHRQVEPILVGHCLKCHGSARKGELDLRTQATAMRGGESGPVLEPGQPDASLLYAYVAAAEMPPKRPLPAAKVAVLKQWIADGAFFPDTPLDPFTLSTDTRAGYDWWSLRPLSEPALPVSDGAPAAWNENAIDRFVYARLVEQGLQPSPPADRRTLIRRATYDLTGLPPTPAEVDAFVDDRRAGAYERLLDRLLQSPHYGEHWGRHWLDVVRFGESTGFERNVIIDNAWPFRDYVIRALNDDKPFDRLVLEQLAGDVIDRDDPGCEIGTAFLVCGPYDNVGNQDPAQAAQIRANTIDDMVRATSESFLGLTVGCARCHDHKFDPISQRDYYRLYATFAGVQHGSRAVATAAQKRDRAAKLRPLTAAKKLFAQRKAALERAILQRAEAKAAAYEAGWQRPPVDRTGTAETWPPVAARLVRLTAAATDANPNASAGFGIDEFEVWTAAAQPRNVALASSGGRADGRSRVAEDFADAYSAALTIDGRFGARWIASGPVLTITLARPETVGRLFFSSDRFGSAGGHAVAAFLCEYRIDVSLDGKSWTEVANSSDRKPVNAAHRRKRLLDLESTAAERDQIAEFGDRLAEVQREIAAVPALPAWWAGTFRQVAGPQHVFLGGNPQRPGAEVVPASMEALGKVVHGYQLPADAPEGERRLALARWLVAADNPLTPRVLANRLWHYHFGTGIVDTPSDFGFMGGRPTHPQLLDWLARQVHSNGWRLRGLHKQIMLSQTYRQASTYRAVAAKRDAGSRFLWRFPPRRLSGEEIRDTILSIAGKLDTRRGGPGFRLYRYLQDNVATYVPLDRPGPATYRRAVYHQNARATRLDLMTEFDCPDSAFAAPRRASTTTPLQALTLMNHRFTLDMAGFLAARLAGGAEPADDRTQVRRAFALAFGRSPATAEEAAAGSLIKGHGLRAFCRALLNSNELVYLD